MVTGLGEGGEVREEQMMIAVYTLYGLNEKPPLFWPMEISLNQRDAARRERQIPYHVGTELAPYAGQYGDSDG